MASKVFIDCGTNFCQGLTHHIQALHIDKTWTIHSFEANPATYKHAKNIISSHYPHLNITLHNKAVWVDDIIRSLTVEYHEPDGIIELLRRQGINHSCLDMSASEALWVGGASNIMEDEFRTVDGMNSIKKSVQKVECIDFVRFLESNFKGAKHEIYIKMDIEGAEFDVISKMLSSDILKDVKEMSIEWHSRTLVSHHDQQMLINKLTKKGISVRTWH